MTLRFKKKCFETFVALKCVKIIQKGYTFKQSLIKDIFFSQYDRLDKIYKCI